jgi:ribosomal protein S12 methylthiotransferase accessory factor
MDIEVSFPGGMRVDALVGGHVVRTDQPTESGGEGSAPGPFELFLASLATCAGYYALAFCRSRNLPTEGLTLRQHVEYSEETHLARSVQITVTAPAGLPDKYRVAFQRAIEACKVKKTIGLAPAVEVSVVG